MKTITATLWAIAALMIFLSSCKKEKEKTVEEIVDEKIENVIPQKYIDTIVNLGMVVYEGKNPPNVNGIYLMNDLTLKNANTGETPGKTFLEEKIKLSNQNNSTFNIDAITNSNGTIGTSEKTIVTGEGNNFTIWGNFQSKFENDEAVFAKIISGTISEEGIVNLKYCIINVNYIKNVDNKFLTEGKGRFIEDANFLSPRIESFELKYNGGISDGRISTANLIFQ